MSEKYRKDVLKIVYNFYGKLMEDFEISPEIDLIENENGYTLSLNIKMEDKNETIPEIIVKHDPLGIFKSSASGTTPSRYGQKGQDYR